MDIRIVLAILDWFVLGVLFPYVRIRSGLDHDEWLYLLAFIQALRNGNYDLVDNERSAENGEK